MAEVDYYTTGNEETITLDVYFEGVLEKQYWEVSCWDSEENNRWTLKFYNIEDAQNEYERWR